MVDEGERPPSGPGEHRGDFAEQVSQKRRSNIQDGRGRHHPGEDCSIPGSYCGWGYYVQYTREGVKEVAEKAGRLAKALNILMPIIRGPKEQKRRVMYAAVEATLMYAAPVWAGALDVARNKSTILAVQRRMALRICSAYRTVSDDAALVIAGLVPIHLTAKERQKNDAGTISRDQAKQDKMVEWQREWDQSTKGRWTRRLITEVRGWQTRGHGQVTFRITQCLTGHGCFGQYLHKIGKRDRAACRECGAEEDSAEYTLFECIKWAGERTEMERKIGEMITPDNMIGRLSFP